MMPAPKKDSSVRARRNKATTRATISPRKNAVIPDLPDRQRVVDGLEVEHGWHEQTRAWWTDVWSSPMAAEWDESDEHNVLIAAMVYDDMWRAETAKERKDAAAEFRLQRVDLGLSPYSRRRLEWTIQTAEDAKDRGQQRRSRQAPVAPDAVDPRAALRAVK